MIVVKTLIFGQYDVFTLNLISKLKKEDHRVFVVTGNARSSKLKPADVFQEYNFKYDSDSIPYILKSIEADMVIFAGSLDSGFNWENESSQVSKYIAGLTNIIIHCKNLNINQFIYVSSCSLFDGVVEEIITEDTEPIAMNNRDKAILMGEKICKDYQDETGFTLSLVRISEIYGTYKDEVIKDSICTSICKQAINHNKVTVSSNKLHNLISVDDAVDSIYRIIKGNSEESAVYHITSQGDTNFSEIQLIKLLEKITDKKIEVEIIKSLDNHNNHNYQSERINKIKFIEKYGIKNDEFLRLALQYEEKLSDKEDIKNGLGKVYRVLEKKGANVNKKGKIRSYFTKKLFKFSDRTRSKILPLIENALFFFILQLFIILTRSISFHEVIDIYLLYVILIAIIYGYQQSVFAVAFSIIGRIYLTLAWDSRYLTLDNYNVYLWVLQIFTIGVLVGYLKDKYKRKYEDLNDEKEYLQLELTNIKDINNSNVEVKSLYEKRLINYNDSFARIYNIISQLDAIEPEKVIFKAINVICEIMNTDDVSIYTCDRNSQFCRLMAASSEKAKTMKKSIKISSHKDIYIKLKRQEIYVNSKMNPNYPIMAAGTYKDERLQTIITIWSLPFENNNLYERNVFGVLSKLVERTMGRAYEYMENINKSYNRKHDDVMDAETFEKILQLYTYGEMENLVDFSLLKVETYKMSENIFYTILKEQLRDTDYIGVNDNDETYILLTNANQNEAMNVISRLRERQITVEIGDRNAK